MSPLGVLSPLGVPGARPGIDDGGRVVIPLFQNDIDHFTSLPAPWRSRRDKVLPTLGHLLRGRAVLWGLVNVGMGGRLAPPAGSARVILPGAFCETRSYLSRLKVSV